MVRRPRARASSTFRGSAASPSCLTAGWTEGRTCPSCSSRMVASRPPWAAGHTSHPRARPASTTTSSTWHLTSGARPSGTLRTCPRRVAAATPRCTSPTCARTTGRPTAATTTATRTTCVVSPARRSTSRRGTASPGTRRCTPPRTTLAWATATAGAVLAGMGPGTGRPRTLAPTGGASIPTFLSMCRPTSPWMIRASWRLWRSRSGRTGATASSGPG
mmetsp:Transcript_2826/g.8449  ORF Transcript_2826/g.8449 Transcript_2826/m.8449 type:complete len:218 (-) Transcript_2826:843-1496(-)